MDETLKMLKDLTDAKGIPGNEGEVREVFKKYISPYADEISYDGLGGVIARKTGAEKGPKIVIAGHLDEVGFMVTKIDDKGFIRFQTVGGWVTHVLLNQKVVIVTSKGENIIGVIGSKPPHIMKPEERKKAVDMKDLFIDIGAESKEQAESWGIRPGDMVVPYSEFTVMKNEKRLLAKAWDNRVGLAVAIGVLKNLQNESHPNIVYGVGTVQEEVGLRGARTAAYKIEPDIGIAVDVGLTGDTPGVTDKDARGELGKGPQIILYDASMVSHKGLRDFIVDVAEELKIPYQYEWIPGGGTDAGTIHTTKSGAPSIAVTIATRYIHAHAGIIHRDDYENTVRLLTEVVKRLDWDAVNKIKYE